MSELDDEGCGAEYACRFQPTGDALCRIDWLSAITFARVVELPLVLRALGCEAYLDTIAQVPNISLAMRL